MFMGTVITEPFFGKAFNIQNSAAVPLDMSITFLILVIAMSINVVLEKGLITSKDLTNELINILKSKRDEVVFRMKLTSKDEFDVLSKRVENLETKINQLKIQKKKKTRRVKKS